VGARRTAVSLVFTLGVALAGCGGPGAGDGSADDTGGHDGSTDAADATTALADDVVTVASFDFPESELLARMYGGALEAAGIDVRYELGLGPREFVQPALARGLVELVPEYAGSALRFVSLGEHRPTGDLAATTAALGDVLGERRLVALDPAPAQDANAVVVTRALAARHDLDEISDLAPVAGELTFGGPPGCEDRPFCLAGLGEVYGLDFARFLPLDVAGPLTHQALDGGHADVALLFTTDPRLLTGELVELADDRALQPAENVTPVVRREVVERWGDPLVDAVDAVSAALSTGALQGLNARVAGGEGAAAVAADWLRDEGLA
jgi:osmoprotectant transport system substrate-binding protein